MQTAKAKLIKADFYPAGRLRRRALLTTAIALPLALGLAAAPTGAMAAPPPALPSGLTLAGGSATATINGSHTVETITQTTDRAVINWNQFNIGAGGTVQINQPNSTSLEVDRVIGSSNPTEILGNLNSNGQVWILNRNGVEFGQGSQVNVNSLVASTGHVSTAQVMSGASQIQITNMSPNAEVVNDGTITAAQAGLVALVGAKAANNGTINALLGRVELAGGNAATVDFNGDGLISIQAPSTLAYGSVASNDGTINANGGVVQMTAADAKTTVDNLINMGGIITAQGASQTGTGRVILTAVGPGKVTIGSNNPKDKGGKINVNNSYAGGIGGSITIDGTRVALNNSADLDVSGDSGGGTTNIIATNNGSTPADISVELDAILNANAVNAGSGGTIEVDSAGTAEFDGQAFLRSYPTFLLLPHGVIPGKTGSITVEGDTGLEFSGAADLRPQNGVGGAGMLTLDTPNLEVGALNQGGTLTGPTLISQLNLSNVTLQGHDITINQSVNSNSINTLTVIAQDGLNRHSIPWFNEPGQFVLNQNVSVENLILESPSADSMDVSGPALPNLQAVNLTLDAPVAFAQTPAIAPTNVTVSSALGNQGVVQQAFDLVAQGGQVLIDGVFDQSATANSAFTLAGIGLYDFIQNLTISNPDLKMTYNSLGLPSFYGPIPTVYAATVNLGADSPATELLQAAYNMVAFATGVASPTLNLGLTQYADNLNYHDNAVTVQGVPNITTLNSLMLSTPGGTITNVNANNVDEDSGSDAQRAIALTISGGNTYFNSVNYNETVTVDSSLNLFGLSGSGTTFNTINVDDSDSVYRSVSGDTVNLNAGTAQQGYNITLSGGVLNLLEGSSYTNLHASTPNVTVNGAPDGSSVFTTEISLNTASDIFNNVSARTVNDNQATAQQGYDLTAVGGALNLGQSNYAEMLDAHTSGVTVNSAAGRTAFNGVTLDVADNKFNNITTPVVYVNDANASQQGIDMVNDDGSVVFNFNTAANGIDLTHNANLYGNGPSGQTTFASLTLDTTLGTLNNVFGNIVNDNQASAQEGYNATAANGTLNLAQSNYTTLDAYKSGVTVNGLPGGSIFTEIALNTPDNVFNNVSAGIVDDNQAFAQQGYDLTSNILDLGQSTYTTLDANKSGVTINGALGGSAFNDVTLGVADNAFNGITTPLVHVNDADASQEGIGLADLGGSVVFNFGNTSNSIDLNRDVNLQGNGPTTFAGLTLDNAQGSLNNIFANTVNDNQGTAQTGYDATAAGGTLNLAKSGYAETLVADISGVTVNGAGGTGTALGGVTLDVADNTFNNITTPIVNVYTIGASQQGMDLVKTGGTVNFGFHNSPETITLDRNMTLNGDVFKFIPAVSIVGPLASSSGTTFGQINLNTAQGQLNNVFGNIVNVNAGPAMRGVNVTAPGGTANLSQVIYVPESLTVPYFMTVNGAPTFSVFQGVTNNVGAILNRIYELTNPNASAQGLTLVLSNPNGQLPNDVTTASLEALLGSLAPAGPGAQDSSLRLCTAKAAGAASDCVTQALENGNTVVVFDITNNTFSLVAENASNQLIEMHAIQPSDVEKLLNNYEI